MTAGSWPSVQGCRRSRAGTGAPLAPVRRRYRRRTAVLQACAAVLGAVVYAAALGWSAHVAMVAALCVAAPVALAAAGPGRRDRGR